MFFLFSIFRIVLRSQLLAGVLLAALVSGFVNLAFFEVTGTIVAIAFSVLWLVAVTRFGLIAGMSMWFVDRVFRTWSMLGPDSWYGGRMYLLLAAVLLLSIYAFITSLGGRSIVPVDLLGDRDNTEHA
jgi:hypothetical protein